MFMRILPAIISRAVSGGGLVAVESVEFAEIANTSLTGITSYTQNLTGTPDISQCVPFVTANWVDTAANDDSLDWRMATIEVIDNAGTPALQLERGTNHQDSYEYNIHVVEFSSGVKIQKLTGTGTTGTVNVTISEAVDLSKTFVVGTFAAAGDWGSQDDNNDHCFRVRFTSTTNVEVYRHGVAGDFEYVMYVIEDTDGSLFDVQSVEGSSTLQDTFVDNSISAVDMDATALFGTRANSSGGASMNGACFEAWLQSTTNIRCAGLGGFNSTQYWSIFAVTFTDGTTVERGRYEWNSSSSAAVEDIDVALTTQVNPARALPKPTHISSAFYAAMNDDAYPESVSTYESFSVDGAGNNLVLTRFGKASTWAYYTQWEVIEFSSSAPPAWTPADLTGLWTWVEVGDISDFYQDHLKTTPVTAIDDPVEAWVDKSGNGNDLLQSGLATYAPIYKDTYINCAGDDYMTIDTSSITLPVELMVGIRFTLNDNTTWHGVFSWADNINDSSAFMRLTGTSGTGIYLNIDGINPFSWNMATGGDHTLILRITKPGLYWLVDVWMDGVQETQYDGGFDLANNTANLFVMSKSYAATGANDFMGIVIAEGTFSDGDVDDLQAYLDAL